MTYTVERIAGGTYTGSGVSPGGTTASFTTDGPNRIALAICITARQLNGVSGPGDYHHVASVSGGGAGSWTKISSEEFHYVDATASASFPDNFIAIDVFLKVVPTAQTGATLTFTMASATDNFVNVGWAIVATIDGGLGQLDTNASNLDLLTQLTGSASAISTTVDTDSSVPFVGVLMWGHKTGGGTNPITIPSGFSTAGSVSGNAKFDASGSGAGCDGSAAFAFNEYATQQTALALTSGSSHNRWFALPIVLSPSGTNGNASGDVVTSTVSLTGGAATTPGNGNASGVTLTTTSSLIAGDAADATEIDGTEIYEITFNVVPSGRYRNSDYDSIYSMGSRIANGLMTVTELGGLTFGAGATPAGAFDNNYGQAAGNGWNPSGQGALGMSFQTGLILAGMRFIGASELDQRNTSWQLVAGMGPSSVFFESYAQEFDYFYTSQDQGTLNSLHYSELEMTPVVPIEWPYYQFRIFPTAQTAAGQRFAEEVEFKVFHSNLDGGDRRSTNGNPNKRVTITLSPDWGLTLSGSSVHPNDAWLDGSVARLNAPGVSRNTSSIGENTGGGTLGGAQTTVGAYIQFEFARPVIQQHFVLIVESHSETYDSGGEPTVYGKWHWEYSKNNGVSWVPIGAQWWFHEDTGNYMLAPHTGQTFGLEGDAGLGSGAKLWRMVLDEGPAFGGSNPTSEIIFNVIDSEELVAELAVAFTDDTDGTPAVATIGAPGNPYAVLFTDGSDDTLTLSFENTPNPILTVDFTDEGTFETVSDLYPTVTIQTVVVATGKAS